METAVEVGSRCVVDDIHYCTVKYVGIVPPTPGVWIGVEYDEENRGKHDGSHEGTKYFDTKKPTSGSFIRARKANFGVTFCEAVSGKYSNEMQDGNILGITNKPVELVGMEKVGSVQSKFDRLQVVALPGQKVGGAGPSGQIKNQTPNIEELDLSKSLLSSWHQMSLITKQLIHLKTLNLSSNRLSLPECPEELRESFRTVLAITLNDNNYTWDEIAELARVWPRVRELSVVGNLITSIRITDKSLFGNLIYLDASRNYLECNEDFLNLGALQRLQTLILTYAGLEKIEFTDTPYDEKTNLFPQLKNLWLNNNCINEWQSVTELNKLAGLIHLNLNHNPILESDKQSTCLQMIVATISGLTNLGGTTIGADERRGAELDYLKMHVEEWLRGGNDQRFKQRHPRFEELVKKYGPPEIGEVKPRPNNLKSKLISLEIRVCDSSSPPITKKLPKSITVQKLKGLLHKILRPPCDAFQLSLSYISLKQNPDLEYKIDNDYRELDFFEVEDGDTLTVRW